MDVRRAARVEEDVALADGRLLRQQAVAEQRLADRLGELPVVAGEAAGEMGEVGVVAAPLPHAVEALEDAAGDALRRVRVLVRRDPAVAAG
jgi:urease alpha subunit